MKNKIIALSVLIILALVFRIGYVNYVSKRPIIELHDMGEWVELDGNFQEDVTEQTNGYAVQVNSARLFTYDEFVTRYGETQDYLPEDARPVGIVDVEISVRNTDNTDGWLALYYYMLLSEDKTFTLYLNSSLLELATPNSGGELGVRIQPNSAYTFHIPYGYFSKRIPIERMQTNYSLVLSRYPIKKECLVKLA